MKSIHSLSFRIPFIISIVIIITVFIITFLSTSQLKKSIEESALDGFSTTATGYAYMLDMVLHEQLSLVQTYALSSHLLNFLEDKTNIEKETILLNRMRSFSNINTYAINIGVTDIEGTILLDSFNNKLKGKSLKTEYNDLFNRLQSANYKFTFDRDTVISSSTGKESLLLLGGIKKNNQLLGLMYVNIDLAMLNKDFIDSLKLKDGARLTIVNSKNIALMSTESEAIGNEMDLAYKRILTEDEGLIPNVYNSKKYEYRSGAFKTSSIMPWTVLYARSDKAIYKDINYVMFKSILIGIILIIFSSLLVFFYVKTITNPLHNLVNMAKEISEGHLFVNDFFVKRNDELGILSDSFYNMRHKLLDIISKVRKDIDQITMDANELSSGSTNLSHRTETQTASLEETASSMEEMASTIKSSTEQSVEGNRMMIESKLSIKDAGAIILETTRNIEEVYEASTKIKNITKIIEDIAFQTNILALNAAVEAARAGDQGRGFAVVASEVRNLAQTTQSSVKDITDLVDNAYDKINKATNSARSSQEIFNEIQVKIDETAKIMQDISSTAIEQQSGVDQVNRAVSEMDTLTQQNAALVEEATASSESLLCQIKDLVLVMSFFKTSDSDNNTGTIITNSYSSNNKPAGKKQHTNIKVSYEDKSRYNKTELKRPVSSMNTTKNDEFGNTISGGDEDSEGFAQF